MASSPLWLLLFALAAVVVRGHEHDHAAAHAHDHDHGHDNGHGHGHNHGHDHGHDHDHDHGHGHGHGHGDGGKREQSEIWMEAFLYTFIITAGGNLVILLFMNAPLSGNFLKIMVSFAVGGLLGDVFLHLLPHAFQAAAASSGGGHGHGGHGHDHSDGDGGHTHSLADLSIGLSILAGILGFFILEKMMRNFSTGGHGHSHGGPKDHKKNDDAPQQQQQQPGSGEILLLGGIKPGAWLNLLADAAHNFTDGLAIGATCQSGTGLATMLAVLFHEIPHEVGDFAILVQQGFSKRSAFFAQFVSALGAFAGCLCGLVVSRDSPQWILGFTAGGFIYISLVSIVPEIIGEGKSSLVQTMMEVGAMCFGISFMIVVALYE